MQSILENFIPKCVSDSIPPLDYNGIPKYSTLFLWCFNKAWHCHTEITPANYFTHSHHYIDVTWVSWCLKSHVTRLFVQQLIQAKTKEISKICIIGSLWGESNGDRWFPSQMARALYYWRFCDTSQEFQPMASQLSKKAALPLAKILATCRNNVSNTGPWNAENVSKA